VSAIRYTKSKCHLHEFNVRLSERPMMVSWTGAYTQPPSTIMSGRDRRVHFENSSP
jgi:hypothetical protein